MNKTQRAEQERADLSQLRNAVRGVLMLDIGVSLAANVIAADASALSRAVNAWPPIALLITVEIVSRVPVTRGWKSVVRVVGAACVATIAAWASYWHMVDVAELAGQHGITAYMLPFSVDGMMVVVSVSLMELTDRIKGNPPPRRTAQPVATAKRGYGAQVVDLASRRPGLTAAQIADEVGCTVKTARQHLARHNTAAVA